MLGHQHLSVDSILQDNPDMHAIAAQLKGVMASLADVEKIAGALQADSEASRKVKSRA